MRYEKPVTVKAAVAALSAGGEQHRALGGGTDLMLRLGREQAWPAGIVDLKAIPELFELRQSEKGLRIGAGLPLARLLESPLLDDYPALAEACRVFAARQIRERATLGGNIANASPAADCLPPLMVHEALCHTDRRTLPVGEVATGPGRTVLAPDEILVSVELPAPSPDAESFFFKLAGREAMAIAVVGVAGYLKFDRKRVIAARIALGAVAPNVIRAPAAEAALLGEALSSETIAAAAAAARAEASPIDDLRGSAEHRRFMIERILAYQLESLRARIT